MIVLILRTFFAQEERSWNSGYWHRCCSPAATCSVGGSNHSLGPL